MVEDLHRDFGRLEGKVDGLEDRLGELADSQAQTQRQVSQIHDTIMRAEGGWRLMVVVGTVAAAIGGLVSTMVGALFGHRT